MSQGGPASGHTIRVPRTARYHVLGSPATAGEVWFVVHGYGQLAEPFIRRFDGLVAPGSDARAVVAPEALSRFYVEDRVAAHGPGSRVGASWMTRQDREHEITDYVEYLDRLADRVAPAPVRRVVLGFSQGAETASRWAVLGSVPPSLLILWGGGLAVDLDPRRLAERLRETQVQIVVGSDDDWARKRAGQSQSMLAEAGVRPELVHYDGGHRIDPAALARLAGAGG